VADAVPFHIVDHSAVRELPGYSAAIAPAITLEGPTYDRGTQAGRAARARLAAGGGGTLEAEIAIGVEALAAAGVPRRYRRQARKQAEAYFYGDVQREEPVRSARLDPPAREALAELVELLVDGRYDELAARSRFGRPEALREAVEDDFGVALARPPDAHYGSALVTAADGQETRWDIFLDLWDGEGVADLHMTARLELFESAVAVQFDDLAP
jgi:hypothetical protein